MINQPRWIVVLLFLFTLYTVNSKCCKRCEAGKPCGNHCIPDDSECTEPHGCACHAHHVCTHHCNPKRTKPCGNKCIPNDSKCSEPHGTACHKGDVERYYKDDDINKPDKHHPHMSGYPSEL